CPVSSCSSTFPLHSVPTRRSSDLLCDADIFCVNVLGLGNRDVAEHFMNSGADRFAVGEWEESHGVPVLASAQSSLICRRKSGSIDRKSTRLNSSHVKISYAVFCLK